MGHSQSAKKKKFCALRKQKCPCDNEYREVCAPGWTPYQAHHLLCVAEVTLFMGKVEIKEAVKNTTWCINDGDNMLGLPVGAATIKHYCLLAMASSPSVPPPWANWPQHTTDHNLYNIEVTTALNKAANAVVKNLDKHKDPSGNLAGTLKAQSKHFLTTLKSRGRRTHAAWLGGARKSNPNWYKPFSMAANPTARTFPLAKFDAASAKQILKNWKTFSSW